MRETAIRTPAAMSRERALLQGITNVARDGTTRNVGMKHTAGGGGPEYHRSER
jgi:hypothetical protein